MLTKKVDSISYKISNEDKWFFLSVFVAFDIAVLYKQTEIMKKKS